MWEAVRTESVLRVGCERLHFRSDQRIFALPATQQQATQDFGRQMQQNRAALRDVRLTRCPSEERTVSTGMH